MTKQRRVRRVRSAQTQTQNNDNTPKLSPEEAFREEYAYVLKDLQRVFIIAGAMFLILFALNFLIQ
ncbi:MAG TPA: hypothetical protein VLL52_11280 [Anaerolineae bacterium]|nr:hypothetical protein [Anaerolineae bacterium]